MDIATVVGVLSGFVMILVAMASGGGLAWFLDLPSALIVVGGTFGAVLIHYPLSDLLGVLKVARHVFLEKEIRVEAIMEKLVEMSRRSRRQGILILQECLGPGSDPFFVKAVGLVVDGLEPKAVLAILDREVDAAAERHRIGAEIFSTMGNFAPAMGMMGTLIGLVQMLMKMNDPSRIGPSMAIALITTFYGVILANLVFLPMAGKLKRQSGRELLVKQMIIEGILSIQAGDNPWILEQKLHAFVSPGQRRSVLTHG